MVFVKKGATPSKNVQNKKKGKKVFEVQQDDDLDMDDMSDDDFDDDDSSEEMQVQKTPLNKTPKGRQSLSEKKVSFQIPGKNSPALKTPKKDNGVLVKKQSTPGKSVVQEFKGMKSLKTEINEEEDSEDDDDDDDEDDDEEDLDIELGEEDDDDEEEEDEDDDDDDEEEDDEEEDSPSPKKMTPVKAADKSNATSPKGAKTPQAAQTPKPEIKRDVVFSQKNEAKHMDEMERRKQRDLKMLFVGQLPKDVTTEELKALSPDVKNVVFPTEKKKGKLTFAFLQFESEEKAEANYEPLQGKKLRGQLLNIDYAGVKSRNRRAEEDRKVLYHGRKLFISGLPLDVTICKISESFPKAFQVCFNISPVFRTATISFLTDEATNEAFKTTKEIEVDGNKVAVLHAVVPAQKSKKHNRKRPGNSTIYKRPMNKNWNKGGGNPSKKFKKENTSEE